MNSLLIVRHNIEVAHRLWQLTGNKCQNIHGHSMNVELTLEPLYINDQGISVSQLGDPLEFGLVKVAFRKYLDTQYDHRLLLNTDDPWATTFYLHDPIEDDPINGQRLPGLRATRGDPSTENISKWIASWAGATFACKAQAVVHETATNAAATTIDWKADDA